MTTAITGARRHRVLGLLTITLCALSQCVCQSQRSDKPGAGPGTTEKDASSKPPAKDTGAKAATEGVPASLPTGDLDGDEKAVLLSVLSEQFDPCGSPKSFLDALKQDKPCSRALQLGKFVVKQVSRGLSKRQIIGLYLKELQRTTSRVTLDLKGSPVFGDPKTAKHVLVEFTDFQCAHCKAAAQPLKELAAKYGAALYVKHLPLDFHTHARHAALASLAAHKQGKFWELYDLLFENQARLDGAVIRELATQTGIDMAAFDADIKDKALFEVLARDLAEANEFELEGTPTIYLDGYQVELDDLESRLKGE